MGVVADHSCGGDRFGLAFACSGCGQACIWKTSAQLASVAHWHGARWFGTAHWARSQMVRHRGQQGLLLRLRRGFVLHGKHHGHVHGDGELVLAIPFLVHFLSAFHSWVAVASFLSSFSFSALSNVLCFREGQLF